MFVQPVISQFTNTAGSWPNSRHGGRGNTILGKIGKYPVMRWDRHTLTAFGGIAALLISLAMLLEDGAVSVEPIVAIIGGVAAIALASLERLKERVATLERRLGAQPPRAGGGNGRPAIGPIGGAATDRTIARPGERRRQPSPPCRRALMAWSSPAEAKPRR